MIIVTKSSETGIALGKWHLYIRQSEKEWMEGYVSKDWKDMRAAPHQSRSRREQCSWWLKGHLVCWEEPNRQNVMCEGHLVQSKNFRRLWGEERHC